MSPAELLLRFAASQLGVFSYDQAIACGFTRRMIQVRLARKEWVRVHPGVYAYAGTPMTWARRLQAAILVAAPGALAARRSAAAVWGLTNGDRKRMLQVVVDHDRRVRLGDRWTTVHRSRTLTPDDHAFHDGVAVTSMARTLVDLIQELPGNELRELSIRGLRTRIITIDDLIDQLDGAGNLAGAASARRMWQRLDATLAGTKSDAEVNLYDVVIAIRDIPKPTCGFPVALPGAAPTRELDLCYPEVLLDVEVDSFEFHSTPLQKERDEARHNWLTDHAWRILRLSPTFISSHPRNVQSRVRSAYLQSALDVDARRAAAIALGFEVPW